MESVMVYIVFALLLSLSISITAISCVLCKRWHKAYYNLREKHSETKKENIKLQHEVYRLTYITPIVEKKKGTDKNGTK